MSQIGGNRSMTIQTETSQQKSDCDEMRSYLTFRTSDRLFAVPVLDIREVTMEPPHTRIPHAPPAVLGYVSIRGTICLAVDFSQLLSIESSAKPLRQLIIFKPHIAHMLGIAVDETGEIIRLSQANREAYSQKTESDNVPDSVLVEMARWKDELLMIVDPGKILNAIDHHQRAS